MRISCFSIMLNLLLGSSMISAHRYFSRNKQNGIDAQRSNIGARCENTIHYPDPLDAAAKKACYNYNMNNNCGRIAKNRLIMKVTPKISCTSIYEGRHFVKSDPNEILLEWPITKISILKKRKY
ncbi:hypothetical protein OnM2_019073 [Erysiphe neolycopersici]|uniref:Uncharacterized protein n=1 Tax=Erysiphe neolycopersici TaxID=212602 RepID=A0A420I3T2_9PEZI|nr:hypothetical protein OnM2_019073 [Erysiphe neolycopersici]